LLVYQIKYETQAFDITLLQKIFLKEEPSDFEFNEEGELWTVDGKEGLRHFRWNDAGAFYESRDLNEVDIEAWRDLTSLIQGGQFIIKDRRRESPRLDK